MWKFQDGISPTKNSGNHVEAIVFLNEEAYEDEEADQAYGTTSRTSSRRLKKALKISEMYSEPRIAVKTGYDFTCHQNRARAWKKV